MKYERLADREGHFLFTRYTDERHVMYHSGLTVPSFHNSVEIIVVAGGSFRVYLDGAWRLFSRGDAIFLDKLVAHSTSVSESTEGLEVFALVISPTYLSAASELDDMTFDTVLPKNGGFDELLELIRWGYGRFGSMNDEMKIGFATLLFGTFKKNYPMHKRQSQRQTTLLLGIMEYISEHYAERINLDILSQKFGYERTYLSKTFNTFLGMNLREYINRYRITMVNSMRRSAPSASLLEIAEKCGFESPNTFYRAYKRYSE